MIDFLIPVTIDHSDRIRNCDIIIKYLEKCNIGNVYLLETYKDSPKLESRYSNINYFCEKQTSEYFNRMSTLNYLAKKSNGPIVSLYDVDVIIPKVALKETVRLLQAEADIVYPYDGAFYDVPNNIVNELHKNLSTPVPLAECILFNPHSHGGAIMINRSTFIEAGMCNERVIGWGYDDDEIYHRLDNLGYRRARTNNPLLHLTHPRNNSVFYTNKFTNDNLRESEKIKYMSKDDIKAYVKTWEWCK